MPGCGYHPGHYSHRASRAQQSLEAQPTRDEKAKRDMFDSIKMVYKPGRKTYGKRGAATLHGPALLQA